MKLGGERVLDLQTLCLLFCQTLESYGADCTPKGTGTYTDTVADWAQDAVDYCFENGFIEADEDGSSGAQTP